MCGMLGMVWSLQTSQLDQYGRKHLQKNQNRMILIKGGPKKVVILARFFKFETYVTRFSQPD